MEKSELDTDCERGDFRNGGRGSISSSSISDVLYCASSLLESITISSIWFRDSRRARLAHEGSLRCICILQTRKTQPPPSTANSQLYSNDYLQASEWKICLSLLEPLLGCYMNPKRFYDLIIPLAKCKNNILAQRILRTYDTYAPKANKGLSLG